MMLNPMSTFCWISDQYCIVNLDIMWNTPAYLYRSILLNTFVKYHDAQQPLTPDPADSFE